MRILLDTHVFLWLISGDPKLSASHLSAILEPGNEVYLSVASVWEAVIKCQTGKLPLPARPAEYLSRQRQAHGIESLLIDEVSLSFLAGLPSIHRDPFDRILVAQALQHRLTIATVDSNVIAYPVTVLPAG